jgi:hypothetical protein
MNRPTSSQIRFVRRVRREINYYMQHPRAQARPGFLARDAARFQIESQFPEHFCNL